MDVRRRCGPIGRFRVLGMTCHATFDPEGVRHVLVDAARLYTKRARGFEKLRLFLGNGLLTSEGEFWLRQRRIAQPAFHRDRVRGFAATMVRAAEDLCARWDVAAERGEVLDLSEEMMRVTLRIAGETLFSVDPTGRATVIARALDYVNEDTSRRINALFDVPLAVPTPRNRRFLEAKRELDAVVEAIIAGRRADAARGARHDDLLAMFMEVRDEETGERMTDAQLRDEVMTMLLAGHETTANALTWALYLLAQHPAVARQLEGELAAVLGDGAPTADLVPRLEMTRRVLDEAMRLYPPAWIVGRSPSEDDALLGCFIPAGSLVFVSPYVMHRNPELWENPEAFDPDRFRPENVERRPRYAYFPFGAGPRLCIGQPFALFEGTLLLAMLARRYRLAVLPGHRVELEPLITLRPKGGIPVTLQRA
jgi:cytochrome P450